MKIPIYFVPGLAASTDIFEHIKLPEDIYEIHLLNWLVPKSVNETIESYAQRMCDRITHENPILVGVSFGGVLIQEMSKLIKTRKLILISSIKCRKELPNRLKLAKATKAYKLLPYKAITNIEEFSKYAFGDFAKKRIELYRKYLSMRDETYLTWAVHNVLNWQQTQPITQNIIHIHGNSDGVFPIKNIENCEIVEGGTHVMILNKAKKISEILIKVTH